MNNHHPTEAELGLFIRRKLNSGTVQLDAKTCVRLQAARQAALAVHAHVPQAVTASVGRGLLGWSRENLVPFAMAMVLLLTLAGGNYMMSVQHIEELEEVDSALLADDLPINAYLDSGFRSWLADHSS